jgi:glyoxylase-like metal-dependent hydrolase (beta-lactamase superfamily II)
MLTVAGMTLEPVLDGYLTLRPDLILLPPDDVEPTWQTDGEWFGPGPWRMPIGGFLLRHADRTVLVDAGMGPRCMPGQLETGRFLESLAAMNVSAAEVTDVVLTHLHADHVGWVTQDGSPTFTNAVHHLHADDWEYVRSDTATGAAAGVAHQLGPAGDLLSLAKGPRTEVLPGIALRHVPGHTPGNCVVEIGAGEEHALLLGDTAHHPVALVDDRWLDNFDLDRDLARRHRAEIAAELERSHAPATGAHFDGGRFGRVVREADGRLHWRLVD